MKVPEKLLDLINVIPKVIIAAFSEENQDRWEDLKDAVGESAQDVEDFVVEMAGNVDVCKDLVLDILRDPLAELGYEIPESRDLVSAEFRAKVLELAKKELEE